MKSQKSAMSGLLGVGSRFEGDILFEGTLRVDGQIFGRIHCKNNKPSTVIISELAVVEGTIVADTVIISGKMLGNVRAIEKIEIHAPGKLEGNVFTCDLMIDDGALFQGECVMIRHLSDNEKEKLKLEEAKDIVKNKLIPDKRMSIVQ